MAELIYTHTASTYQLVLDRLPFLTDDEATQQLVGRVIYEVMVELEECFNVASGSTPPDSARVGNDAYYTMQMRSVVADLTAVYLLILNSAKASAASGGDTGTTPLTFIKAAQAGSARVEFDQFDTKKGGTLFISDLGNLLTLYKKSAIRRARALGCTIDICEDCTDKLALIEDVAVALPFIISVKDCGCGC